MDPFDSPKPTWEVSRNEIRLERPDLVFIAFRGSTTTADTVRMKEIYDTIGEKVGRFYAIVDATQIESLEPGARAVWLERDKPYPIRHIVAYGGSFSIRMVVMTMYRAARILSPSRVPFPMEFATGEQEARARIDQIRRAARHSVHPR
ncbi:hypothetical protein [Polyangium sp. 15x6]|uniref:hypothetical protein n=1 Tax=Polyangium sp. 15x6 TaxID=3042687 RepID=UPI00249A28CB|nr:hypothetical protein [Polyangium sp. 15x6]MDI3282251.1 hypothetical protein [Polyangium sp. 15x6]